MDYRLSNEQRDIQSAAREFAEKEFPEVGPDCDMNMEFPEAIWRKAGELGFVGSTIPEEHGGPGQGLAMRLHAWRLALPQGVFTAPPPWDGDFAVDARLLADLPVDEPESLDTREETT